MQHTLCSSWTEMLLGLILILFGYFSINKWNINHSTVIGNITFTLKCNCSRDTTERLHFHLSFSCIGEGNGNPLQCSCLENPRNGGAWWATIYGVAQSRTRLKRLSSSSRQTRIDAFELWCWRRLLRVSWTARRSSQFILKEISPGMISPGMKSVTGRNDAETEAPLLWPPDAKSWLIGKDSDAGKDWGQEEKRVTEDEMVGWHHQLNGHEFEQTQGDMCSLQQHIY